MARKDYTGMRFGRLTVLEPTDERKKPGNNVYWLCKCDCGNIIKVPTSEFRVNARTKSCGCLGREKLQKRNTTHGGSRDRLYTVWMSTRRRCYDEKLKEYKNYGKRGIKVCEYFEKYENFKKWAMENGYVPTAKYGECTLDRIDTSKGYCPENCRWVSLKEQENNRRNNTRVTYNGETKTITQWEQKFGMTKGLLRDRLKRGWTVEDAINRPKQLHKN